MCYPSINHTSIYCQFFVHAAFLGSNKTERIYKEYLTPIKKLQHNLYSIECSEHSGEIHFFSSLMVVSIWYDEKCTVFIGPSYTSGFVDDITFAHNGLYGTGNKSKA